jgi:hypothetical protein
MKLIRSSIFFECGVFFFLSCFSKTQIIIFDFQNHLFNYEIIRK